MNIQLLKEDAEIAKDKWREYKDAAKKTRDPIYTDLKKVYNQIKNGNAVINIFDAIRLGGIRSDNAHPKLAISSALATTCFCRYTQNGTVRFSPRQWPKYRNSVPYSPTIELNNCLPELKISGIELKAPVPIIPPRLRPIKLTDDYFILWEVDSWTPIPSKDPYLLKRLTKEMFVVCAGWDLTEIEIKVMQGRIAK